MSHAQPPSQSDPQSRSALLRARTRAFTTAFLSLPTNPPSKILADQFTPSNPRITEHGPAWVQSRLPFLGRTFEGRDQCEEYFGLLADTLKFLPDEDTFPPEEEFVVDPEARAAGAGPARAGEGGRRGRGGDEGSGRGVVSLVARARFESVRTGKGWDEVFCYRLSGFDEQGRIGHWEIWADPLSAWVACEGGSGDGG